ncbi:alpha/beta hydrolase fold domain-containing protein [Actinophytocola oryzae]|uniref:Alpha/beta hydrolase family protein n=1 Tax=Actinophytocola oryzae TaxID=502181 RepID=A0A4R7VK78_9PSEU|nr:alpha/beta hydrolase fold domain-containing protein [Actinophytocola oryzae]TDV49873.1 alpha/beta hydrolase family protein [Actinophytocola oryzae]
MAADVHLETGRFGTVVRPREASGATVLQLSTRPDGSVSGVGLAERLAERTGATVVCSGYRPSFPAALADARDAYRFAQDLGRVAMVGGEMLGAGLAASLLVDLRDTDEPMPGCMVLRSALLDLTLDAKSLQFNASTDPRFDLAEARRFAAVYAAGLPRTDSLLSPLHANLDGLPPVRLLVASSECLLDDSLGFAARVAHHRIPVDLRVWRDAETLREEAVGATAEFLATWGAAERHGSARLR